MSSRVKEVILKYGIPSLAILVFVIQLLFVSTKKLNRWKGGGYGMYTEIHYYYNQIYVPNMSVDSLLKDDPVMKATLGRLMLMPNKENLIKAAKYIQEIKQKDSIHIQIWKPVINSNNGVFSRVLIDEVYLLKSGL